MQFNIVAALAGLAAVAQAAAIAPAPMMHNTTMMEAEKAPMKHNKTMMDVEKPPMMNNGSIKVAEGGPISATVVVSSIKKVTTVSHTTNVILTQGSTNPFSFPATASKFYTSIKSIVTFVTTDITMLKAAPKATYSSGDQNLICNAFIDFVKVHQALLHTVIGKHALLSVVPFVGPFVATVLREIEGGVDTLAFIIIGEVPTCASSAQKAQASLHASLQHSIQVYSS